MIIMQKIPYIDLLGTLYLFLFSMSIIKKAGSKKTAGPIEN